MLTLNGRDAVAVALSDPDIDPCLRSLLAIRASELFASDTTARIFVVEAGDSPEVIEAALGFAIGEGAPDPGYLWIQGAGTDHFEIAIRRPDATHVYVFVEDSPSTEMGLHAFCLAQFWPACEGGR